MWLGVTWNNRPAALSSKDTSLAQKAWSQICFTLMSWQDSTNKSWTGLQKESLLPPGNLTVWMFTVPAGPHCVTVHCSSRSLLFFFWDIVTGCGVSWLLVCIYFTISCSWVPVFLSFFSCWADTCIECIVFWLGSVRVWGAWLSEWERDPRVKASESVRLLMTYIKNVLKCAHEQICIYKCIISSHFRFSGPMWLWSVKLCSMKS